MSARDVFINCPFTEDYEDHFRAIVFAIIRCGFTPRCARESEDGSEVRIAKLCRIIKECPFAIHDISKTEPDKASGLPRFNMPFELGLYLGAKLIGAKQAKAKKVLIFDTERYRYQQFLSDIAGQDIQAHAGKVPRLIQRTANWLRAQMPKSPIPGGLLIAKQYTVFKKDVPAICKTKGLSPDEMTFTDLTFMAAEWISEDAARKAK